MRQSLRMMAFVVVLLSGAKLVAAETFRFLPIACRVLDTGDSVIPAGSVIRFKVSPAGVFGAWQYFAEVISSQGVTEVFQNGFPQCGIPAAARGAQLSLTVIEPDRTGHVTIWPDGHQVPGVSQMNTYPGITLSEEVTVGVCRLGVCPYDIALFLVASPRRVIADITAYLDP